MAAHQTLLSELISGLKQPNVQTETLFTDRRWRLVRSFAPRQSWLAVLEKNGFPCSRESELPVRVDPATDLIEIGQYAGASREQLLALTLWLAPSLWSCQDDDAPMADGGPLTWEPVRLSTDRVEFDSTCLGAEVEVHDGWTVTHQDSTTQIKGEGDLRVTVAQGRYRLLETECLSKRVPIEYLCESILEMAAHVEKYESQRPFGSRQFWHGIRVALNADGIIGCCPLMAPSSFAYASWTGTSADWGSPDRSSRLIYSLLDTTPELQQSLSHRLQPDRVWFALTRRSNLDRGVKRVLERTGQVVKVFKKGTKVAASKGSSSTGKLRAIQNLEDWCVWASNAATQTGLDTVGAQTNATDRAAESGQDRGDPIHEALMAAQAGTSNSRETARIRILKHRLDDIRLTTDGVVPLDLACASSREALLGPAGAAYMRSGIVVATDGSLKKCGAMGAAFVAKDGRVQARSVAVFGQPSSIRPELTGIALALEECPIEEDLTILTDSLSSMDLLQSMQRGDFPLSLYRHSVRHLLLHVVTLLNKRAAAGRITRFIKVRAHRGEPLNEAADALAAAAADLDPGRPVTMDLDPEAVHFMYRETWVEWDKKVREDLVQRAAELCLNRMLRPKRGRAGTAASPPALPLTAAWMLRPNQGRDTLGKVLGDMSISTAKKQVLQSIAGAFPCNAVLHKWGIAPSPACALCGHPAETQSHVQCSCPVLKEARIRAHHNLAQRLWKGIRDASKGWIITTEQTVAGLQGLPQPEELIPEWQRAWDELTDLKLGGEGEDMDTDATTRRKRPDAWAVHWGMRRLFILEFTRPNDRDALALQDTDSLKTARYIPLRDRLVTLLPAWEVGIQTYTMGIRGSHDPDRWHTNLTQLGLPATRMEALVRNLTLQALTELTNLYSTRYAALHCLQHAQ